jgi:hypothetical protein
MPTDRESDAELDEFAREVRGGKDAQDLRDNLDRSK